MKESQIAVRQEKTWELKLQGFSHEQIAQKLGVSTKTVRRDLCDLKKKSVEWMERLPKGEIQLFHRTNFEIAGKITNELWKLYEESKDEKQKLAILTKIAQTRKTLSDMTDLKEILELRDSIHRELAPVTIYDNTMFGQRKEINYDKL